MVSLHRTSLDTTLHDYSLFDHTQQDRALQDHNHLDHTSQSENGWMPIIEAPLFESEDLNEPEEFEEEVPKFLSTHKENELVVLGAYRRSGFSRMFRPSMADILMKEVDTPLFIAHQ